MVTLERTTNKTLVKHERVWEELGGEKVSPDSVNADSGVVLWLLLSSTRHRLLLLQLDEQTQEANIWQEE